MAIASLHVGTVTNNQANASASENLMGWIWADPIGWVSVNDLNPSSCSLGGGCGTYGLHLNPTTRQINGFAWNDGVGWICFGSSCAAAAPCRSVPPSGNAADMKAYVDAGTGTVDVHGWANICSLGESGWISLNCGDAGTACTIYPYRVKFVTTSGYFGNATPPPNLESYAWQGNLDGTGLGYMDFSNVHLSTPETGPTLCSNGTDDDLNGLIDCQQSSCSSAPNCQEDSIPRCKDNIDNNLNGPKDCHEASCRVLPGVCDEVNGNTDAVGTPMCANGVDDDADTLIDCVDGGCSAYPGCTYTGEAACGLPGGNEACCSDSVDNDGNGPIDCADSTCSTASMCLPVWLQAKYGDIYARAGITGISTTSSKATYCLTTTGAITGFTSQVGCNEASSNQSLTLPTTGTGYKGTLGSLDVNGILSGKYGQVVTIASDAAIPAILGGKVYRVVGSLTLNAKIFQNGSGTTRGNGLLLVDGGDLTIAGNIDYATEALPSSIRNLASFGVIVKKSSGGAGGNIFINPSVTKISGAYFAEESVSTGSTGGVDVRLEVFGLMAARQFKLQRRYRSVTEAAETFVFDARAVANPPPGMQEIGKSLPASKDAF